MPTVPFGRVLTAMVTPMAADGSLDLRDAARLAEYLVDDGNDGLVVNGTTGESATTSDEEKDAVLRAVVAAVGDRATVVAGVGSNDTAHTLRLTAAAHRAGADGVLVVTPYYNKPPQRGLIDHFTAVADASELPLLLYDIPGRCGVPIATPTLIELARHPRIVAVKDAKGDLWASTQVMRETDLAYYSGDDAANLAHLTQGGVGIVGVTSHVATAHYARMIQAVLRADLPAAIEIHRRLVPAVDAVMGITQGAIMVKAALADRGILSSAAVRLPLVPATGAERDALAAGLQAAGLR